MGVLTAAGSWITMVKASGDELGKWQGQPKLIGALFADEKLATKLTALVRTREKLAPGKTVSPEAISEPETDGVSEGTADQAEPD